MVNGAYTRYVYSPNQYFAQTFTTINDLNPANEFYTTTVFDGHDRVRAIVSDHPTSLGQHKAQYNDYDTMGWLLRRSNPTEINSGWGNVGDDAGGWAWSYQAYDWQGRLTLSTDQEGKTKEILYDGCGCAGGQEVVTRDEVGRRQKMTYDILGRLKTAQTLFIQPKELPLNGSGTIYSTTTNTYNVRDQITNVNVEDEATSVSQNTQMFYDGHGRLKERRLPIYLGNPQSATPYDSYEYFNDDTLKKVIDPRGASTTYGYNNRHLVTSIAYVPNSAPINGIVPTPNVTFVYDEAGNRTSMTSSAVTKTYVYNQLSQLTSETHQFSDLTQLYTLGYEYNLAGLVKKVTDPWGANITYTFNKAGEAISATANTSGHVYGNFDAQNNQVISQFAANIQYRAWGGIKSFTNGNVAEFANFILNYNGRLHLTRFEAAGRATEHFFNDDGRVRDVTDLYYRPPTFANFDRHYDYDHLGRLINATAGTGPNNPYSLTYGYDVWDHTTSRQGNHWSQTLPPFTASYVNNRDTTMSYDVAGNVIDPYVTQALPDNPYTPMHYDAAGRLGISVSYSGVPGVRRETKQDYDSDGERVRDTVTDVRYDGATFPTMRLHYI